ncbi:hypothetical protein Lal_00016153 [Lupinus albus]|uniref:Uncharacterized protein n=1 Tax=Lupinus albus TaxID=3870 RepID=A0A6A4QJ26_LUPAL|nr:hypothetical protein Lalb_Chr05g0217551 [Lupinus albus]KAF1873034.1 hypothetical protein Lal_00016153 [Lupinus albus]
MGMKESPTAMTTLLPLILRNIIAPFIIYALNCFLFFVHRYQLIETFRGAFLFFLRFVPSSFLHCVLVPPAIKRDKYDSAAQQNDTGIGRALSQILSIVNDIPVSSRKYEVVRCLAERVIEENHNEGVHALRRVNREVLSSAFGRTLNRLEVLVENGNNRPSESGEPDEGWVNRVLWVFLSVFSGSGWMMRGGGEGSGVTAEKLAAELVWLAQRMAACGCVEEAVGKWAPASNLGWLALSAEPRLQASLLKLAAFLLKEAKDMGLDESGGGKMELQRQQVKLKMVQSWLPLLCRASNGTDAPVLSLSERSGLEKLLEETIEELEKEEEQEQVLSLWLHHFTHSPSSDWPNLHACYARWCNASRNQLLLQ